MIVGRSLVFGVETKTRIVLSVLVGEVLVAGASREEKVFEQAGWPVEG